MSNDPPFEPPAITDEDIRWAADILGLKENAFHGRDGGDARQDVIKCIETIDVAACPGSGKTTLLVAKLAILAERWSYRTRGICVLSHTNVARHEIERRLGNTAVGQRLLSYPHFIGTIHGFVNEFLAIPWLQSLGCSIKMINTEICQKRRWGALPRATRNALETNGYGPSLLSVKSSDFAVGPILWGKKRTALGMSTPTYNTVKDVCQRSTMEGYFCYDEMFVWATALIGKLPSLVHVIRDRFPLLFIDEAQDNGEEQSLILHRVFMEGGTAVIRQRFGDGNQAIFDFEGAEGATTHKFPEGNIKHLPNSYRFGQSIAGLANPLGICPIPQGLKGQGPRNPLASGAVAGPHTIFLFDESSVARVLNAFGDLLMRTFSEKELREGTFIAVGQRHRPPDTSEHRKFPHCIRDYWSGYDPELVKRDPHPSTFVRYISAGASRAKETGETYLGVDKIAEGVLRLARMAESKPAIPHRRQCHRHVLRLLEDNTGVRRFYELLVSRLVAGRKPLTRETWEDRWRDIVRCVAEGVAGSPLSCIEGEEFLSWKNALMTTGSPCSGQTAGNNIYRYSRDGRKVPIRVGSIHSVKGETHTATLVLETYWKDRKGRHNIELLLPWLEEVSLGAADKGPEQQTRLRIHYVAMTRPTHLLCLAMQKSCLQGSDANSAVAAVKRLQSRGWDMSDLT
jgi:hypothetical protein